MRLGQENNQAPFRFLKPEEFAALSAEEKVAYLDKAHEALKSKLESGPLSDYNYAKKRPEGS